VTSGDRVGRLDKHPLVRSAGADRDLVAAAVADTESKLSAALALWLQGQPEGLQHLLDESAAPVLAGVPVVSTFEAAAEALAAAVGDDPTRGWAAIMALQERSAEFAAAVVELKSRHAAGNDR
jgi:hypothetical protein